MSRHAPTPTLVDAQRLAGPTLNFDALVRAAAMARKPTDVCPFCHTRLAEVRRHQMLGCPLCYVVFENEVLRIVS